MWGAGEACWLLAVVTLLATVAAQNNTEELETLTCATGFALDVDNRTCVDRDECREWGPCHQLCVNTEGSYICSCAPGYAAGSDGRCTAREEGAWLALAHERGTHRLDLQGSAHAPLTNMSAAVGLDYHYHRNLVFWSNLETQKIYSQPLNASRDNSSYRGAEISVPGSWAPVALAVDWVGNKLYVVDAIGQKVDVFELDGRWHAILLVANLTNPADIALDPTLGLMFIADGNQIVRANMDGTHSKTIVSDEIAEASGVAVETITKRIFWCDSLLGFIETVDYDGNYRVLVLKGHVSVPSRLTLFEDRIYWLDHSNQRISSINKYEGSSSIQAIYKTNDTKHIIEPKAMTVVHPLKQTTVNNPCGQNNGGCSQMCIVTALQNGGLGYRCACNVGYRLGTDLKNCEIVTDFLLYSQKTFIRGKVLDTDIEEFSEAILPIASKNARFIALDFDAKDEHIYYSDFEKNVIYRIHRNGTNKVIVQAPQEGGVEGMAVDWVSKNLYYIDSKKGTLNVLSTRNVSYKQTLLKGLKRPRAIVVHPHKGFIFFSEWDRPANISRANTDGSDLMVFKNLTLKYPNGLSIDFDTERIYWCDSSHNVQHSNLDGTDVKTVASRLIRRPFSIVVYKNFMYISDWKLNAIVRLHKLTGEQEDIVVRNTLTNNLHYGVKVYSKDIQKIEPLHPCATNNGNCHKFCFAIPGNKTEFLSVKCGCPYGETLAPDETSCIADSNSVIAVQACRDALDFKCNNGRCIPIGWVCNGDDDCLDNSDEQLNCASRVSCPTLNCEFKCEASLSGGTCACADGFALAADNRTCVDRDECNEWGLCHQLCVNTPGSYSCSCAPGYTAGLGGRCEVRDKGAWLALAHERGVLRLDLKNRATVPIVNTSSAAGFDYHYRRNLIFWSDIKTQKIYLQSLNASADNGSQSSTEISVDSSWTPVALAVDWVGDKLYVVDATGLKVDVFELDGRWHTVVLGSDLNSPADIALDPLLGIMFIADGKQIVRANMDGTHSRPIVSEAIALASGIAVDTITKRIFWCDSIQDTIETVNYDGKHRFLVLKGHVSKPSRLALFGDRVYWTDSTSQGISSVNKYEANSSIQVTYKSNDTSEPKAMTVVHSIKQTSVNNPCGQNNGGCSQMCIVTALQNEGLGYRCACNIGYRLKTDLRNCEIVKEFLVYSQQRHVKGKILDLIDKGFSEAILPITSKRARFVALDFDARDGYIYSSDVLQNIVQRYNRNGTTGEIIHATQDGGVEGLAVDWVSKNLYYIDSKKGTLNVLSTRNVSYKQTLLKGLKRPRAIVVHPHKGFIFFSEWDRPANISRANTDGSDLMVFKNVTLGWPNGLSIDFDADRIYWCDALLSNVRHSNFDGTDVKTITSTLLEHPFAIVIYRDFMYITEWKLNAIFRLHKLTGEQEDVIVKASQANRPNGVKMYSEELQKIEPTHPCAENNGNCEKFCFAIPTNNTDLLSVKCGCPYGEKLGSDEKSCIVDLNAEPTAKACRDTDFTCSNGRCILMSWTCDGDDDCLDNSDENLDCNKTTCSASEFMCKSGRCIPATFKCDSENDCGDYSDEAGCDNVTCSSTVFQCGNGRCVPNAWKCDSENDCGDGSDEAHCVQNNCTSFQFKCPSNNICIPISWVCDRDYDCFGKEDEADCQLVTCLDSQYKCADHKQCIPMAHICNGALDCKDGSDEVGCASPAPPA